jgi:uncharacterized protein (TIGR02145 family)
VTQTNSTSSISIGWGAVSGATGYYIYRSTSTVGPYARVGTSETAPYTDNDLSDGTTYYYRISSYNSGGEGSQSAVVSATTQPVAPTGVTAAANSTSSIVISWSSVKGATGYYIYRGASLAGSYERVGTSTAASYTNSSLTAGTAYYYKVSAYNSVGEGSQSDAVSAATLPVAPTGVKVAANSTTSITIGWSSVTGATGYRVYRSSTASGTYEEVGTSATTTYENTGLTAGTAYYYKVAAYSSGGEGSQSSAVSAATLPVAPTGVTAAANSTSSITVSWSSVTGATGYLVYRSASLAGSYEWIDLSTTTSYTNSSLTAGTAYYYKVSANSSGGQGSQSDAVSTATLPVAPTGVTAAANSTSSITVSWSSVAGATGYRVYRSSTDYGTYEQVGTSATTSYENTGLTTSTAYYYKVSAYNSGGEGSQSSYVAKTTPPCNANFITQYCSNGAVKTYGTVSDGQRSYRTVAIGTQTWMAENLNYAASGSKCYAEGVSGVSADSISKNCTTYGRLYNWATAMSLPLDCNSSYCYSQINAKHRGICPSGWHIPSNAEWTTLTDYVGGEETAGTKLKSTGGWNDYNGNSGNGTDNYGFSALPAGGYSNGGFNYAGNSGCWWSASEYSVSTAYSRIMNRSDADVFRNFDDETDLFSVRCVQD